jgi:alpha-L-fucosidase 2
MKKPCFIFLPGIPVAVMGLIAVMTAFADDHVRSNALRIVDPYAGTWSSPPRLIATDQTTDAPLLGNGDVGVAITGTIDSLSFFLGKTEWWSLTQGNTQPLARVIVRIPKMKGAGYSMRQGLRCAECTGTFSTAGKKIEIQSWIAATDNLLVTRFVLTGDSAVPAAVALTDGYGKTDQAKTSVSADVASLDVAADNVDAYKGYPTRKARLSVKVVGATGTPGQGTVSFTLPPSGKDTIYIIIAIVSNTDAAQYQTASVDKIKSLTGVSVASLNDAHREWWAAYYGKSFIEIPDKTIEKYLYGSLYLLGCCMRGNEYPPGLWGNWAMKAMGWNGDFTLNYNYEAPFFGLYNLNHADIASCYEKPVLDWIPNGQSAAKNAGFSGLYYGVHIGPLPDGSADKNFWNQKSMTAFAAVPMLFHWFYTRDKTYAASVYDYLRQ